MSYPFLITVDVEEWFQVENFKAHIAGDTWNARESRVQGSVQRLLDLFDSLETPPKATFFVLGWIAERMPDLVRTIQDRGHEIASHGYGHDMCDRMSARQLARDLSDSKNLLEQIIGRPVLGYRAPSFSISEPVLEILAECGYTYDSSYNSFGLNKRYGRLALPQVNDGTIIHPIGPLIELPISNLSFSFPGRNGKGNGKDLQVPIGGGAYFRIMPLAAFTAAVRRYMHLHGAYLFYLHPWEVDPDQPRVADASRFARFRHYTNLKRTRVKLNRLITMFKSCRFITCAQYLQSAGVSAPLPAIRHPGLDPGSRP